MSRRGFTLRELLLVIAVVAILAGLLFPVFSAARERGRSASCLSNVGQLAKATLIYSGTNDDRYPNDSWLVHVGLAVRRSDALDVPTLRCPDYRPATIRNNGVESGGYARNACLQYVPTADAPSQVVMIGEVAQWEYQIDQGGPGTVGRHQASTDWIMAPDETTANSIEDQYGRTIIGPVGEWGSRRHSGRGNYAFVDCHAKSVPAEAFFVRLSDLCGRYSVAQGDVEGRLRFASLPFGSAIRSSH